MTEYQRTVFVADGQHGHEGWVDEAGKEWDMPDRIDSIVDRFQQSPTPLSLYTVEEAAQSSGLLPIHDITMVHAQHQASVRAAEGAPATTVFDIGAQGSSLIYSETFGLAMRSVRAAELAASSITRHLQDKPPLSAALCRPPGHHAGRSYYHGFCFLNNAAVAANVLKQKSSRVAIIDIDVHHGDGTQDIFYEDPSVLYASLHADLQNPSSSSGRADETGRGLGRNTNANFPFEVGVSAKRYNGLLAKACEYIDDFKPDALVVSAGFDGHKGEFTNLPPITHLEDQHYFTIGATIGALKLPTCVVLEGGYNLQTLPGATEAFMTGLEQGMR